MHTYGTPLVLAAVAFAVLSFVPVTFFDVTVEQTASAVSSSTTTTAGPAMVTEPLPEPVDVRPVVQHVPLPEAVKAIYMTSCVAGTPSFRTKLVELIRATEINSVVIDIKDYSGTISFPPESTEWQSAWVDARCGTRDMPELITMLHDHDIYVIGRITVFQDPYYAPSHPELAVLRSDQQTVWKDGKGLSFIDVASKPYWDHIIQLSVDSYNIGFDELNFDYVRYPSDGNMSDTYYPQSVAGQYGMDRQANLEAFFKYLNEQLDDESKFSAKKHTNTGRVSSTPYTSADLFGMTTTNYDDLSIGQVQDRAVPYFDFIAPMVYPSHYPNNYLGLGDPNDHPYEVVYHAMKTGVDRLAASTTPMNGFLHEPLFTYNASGTPLATGKYTKPVYGPEKLRTWIQDFDYGGDYDAADVRTQIQASYDAGVESWMIWAPSNIYTKAALLPAATSTGLAL
ncbi:hypothetical protein KC902_02240 [Candidatus Kaiserbacteria bacterium]|nr:hypothetical protein [Candidatus Kaiserbacteria bacterium]